MPHKEHILMYNYFPRSTSSPCLQSTNFNTVRCLVQWSNAAHYWRTAYHFEANMESQHGGRGIMRVQPVVLYVVDPMIKHRTILEFALSNKI